MEADATKPSGDQPGGYVVYRQTMELAHMLKRQVRDTSAIFGR